MRFDPANIAIAFVGTATVCLGVAILRDRVERSKLEARNNKERIKQL